MLVPSILVSFITAHTPGHLVSFNLSSMEGSTAKVAVLTVTQYLMMLANLNSAATLDHYIPALGATPKDIHGLLDSFSPWAKPSLGFEVV